MFVFAAGTMLCALTVTGCTPTERNEQERSTDAAYLEQIAESWSQYYAITDPPKVDVVRFIGTEEVDTVHRTCLIEAGYQRDSVGLISVPEGQESAFALAEFTCRMQYPVPEHYAKEWGNKEVRTQYAWTRDFVMPCLEAEGHPTEGLPSESVFIETWDSGPFYPFAQVRIDASAEAYNEAWAALEARCPQIVPGEVLWDGVSIESWSARRG